MAKLIPGRIRNQGIDLYDAGKIKIISEDSGTIDAEVDGTAIRFALDDHLVSCACDLFQRKHYCQHLAAIEHYLKNDSEGKELADRIEHKEAETKEVKERHSFGSLFLDSLAMVEDDSLKYQLSASCQQSPYSMDLWWTLRIRRLPDERSYIVRDIKGFLSVVKKEGFYQIGKNYYEKLSLLNFDWESQELIEFLWRLIPDSERFDSDFVLPNHGRNLMLPSGFFEEGVSLMNRLWQFDFEFMHSHYPSVIFRHLDGEDGIYQFKVEVHQQAIELSISDKNSYGFFDNQYLFHNGTFYYLDLKQQKLANAIKSLPLSDDLSRHIFFDMDEQAKLADSLLEFKQLGRVEAPKTFDIHDFKAIFDFDIAENREITLSMTFDFGKDQVKSQEELANLPFASNYKKESRILSLAEAEGFTPGLQAKHEPLTAQTIYDFFNRTLIRFERLGKVRVSEDLENLRSIENPNVSIRKNGGLLDISFDFAQVQEDDIDQALEALFTNEPYFISKTGQLVVFDEETQKVSQALQNLRAKQLSNGHLELDTIAAYQLSEAFKGMSSVSFSQEFESLAYDLVHPEDFVPAEIKVDADLRDYQMTGVKWLSMLDYYGFGGILADDMGLGKTLQTISFLTSRLTKESKVLILSPSSLIYNWKDEFSKFAPDLDVAVSYGLKPVRDQLIAENHQVVITSYTSFRQDFDQYSKEQYDYLILDEAQVMKNAQTKIAKSLREFDVKNCFALSGTPIENRLTEIWSIFQIVLPGLLPGQKAFAKMDAKQVARYIKPFVMRRKKEDVLPELPDLIEINYPNELAESQKAIYLAQLRQMQESILGHSDSEINRQKIEILSGITRLRQICDTPSLFMDYDGDSGKLDSLRQLLTQIKENGHRALIFSQFRGMLDIAEAELENLGLSTYKITGSTPADQRQEMTRAFNSGSKDAFLISLKAGGVGLNLTGADTVVLIDLWWNPAVEMQAISRAHRIGQQENVEVYRLITRGTIEEKILELQESKKHLVNTVLDGNESRGSMTIDDIKEILGISQ
ncbi:DEAD/DEAH box helicase [Streptococcus loxodontisalivarius]|uniref:SNF2 family DNA or RNA helicase n=1 Tax=Streptococcus loxodontisalivarius TaxID=1349415 RepID=A0ABS2PUT6_9STRE|nr:DEAD/DEAH box helicase [Streptococcus loxodontisalivarius]MBM7643691.1 SNF2 family DNA or RNA helicase [Streptococcus loxodontisalivarius]